MVKTGVFKKIAALTAALTIVGSFAVSASAVKVNTTTTYVQGDKNKVTVTAAVTEVGGAYEVTYYATNSSGNVVHADQDTANASGAVTFTYVTDTANLRNNAKIGYTGATTAATDSITGYKITVTDGGILKVPSEDIVGTHTLDYVVPTGKVVTGVTATGATATYVSNTAKLITVALSNVTSDVVITVQTQDAALAATGSHTDSGAVKTASERKISVLANVANATEYGVIISASAIDTTATTLPGAGVYAAQGKSDDGYFAVQLIDEGTDGAGALIQSGVAYNTAVYYKNANGTYTIVAGETVTAQ